jgi:hypothetical protein
MPLGCTHPTRLECARVEHLIKCSRKHCPEPVSGWLTISHHMIVCVSLLPGWPLYWTRRTASTGCSWRPSQGRTYHDCTHTPVCASGSKVGAQSTARLPLCCFIALHASAEVSGFGLSHAVAPCNARRSQSMLNVWTKLGRRSQRLLVHPANRLPPSSFLLLSCCRPGDSRTPGRQFGAFALKLLVP